MPTDREGRWRAALEDEVRKGVPVVLAAGGDGTVGAVASALLACPNAAHVALGAVGLGSSNDFQKPFGVVHAGVPLRIDVAGARPRDVGRALFSRNGEPPTERAFLVSASLGVTARANALFNEGRGALLGFLKRRWVDGAVFYAALAALESHADIRGLVRLRRRGGAVLDLEPERPQDAVSLGLPALRHAGRARLGSAGRQSLSRHEPRRPRGDARRPRPGPLPWPRPDPPLDGAPRRGGAAASRRRSSSTARSSRPGTSRSTSCHGGS